MTEDTPGASRPTLSLGACGVNRISTTLLIFFGQLLEMYVAGTQTDKLVGAANGQKLAAEGFAKSAEEIETTISKAQQDMQTMAGTAAGALKATQLSFRDDERAWIAISTSRLYFESPAPWPLGAQIEITNVGKTPALHVTHAFSRFIWPPPMLSGPTPKLISELAFDNAAPVPPQGKTTISLGNTPSQPQLAADWVSIQNGSQILYIFGEIRYEDTFGRAHSTKFCFYLARPDTNVLAFCKGFNDMK